MTSSTSGHPKFCSILDLALLAAALREHVDNWLVFLYVQGVRFLSVLIVPGVVTKIVLSYWLLIPQSPRVLKLCCRLAGYISSGLNVG